MFTAKQQQQFNHHLNKRDRLKLGQHVQECLHCHVSELRKKLVLRVYTSRHPSGGRVDRCDTICVSCLSRNVEPEYAHRYQTVRIID